MQHSGPPSQSPTVLPLTATAASTQAVSSHPQNPEKQISPEKQAKLVERQLAAHQKELEQRQQQKKTLTASPASTSQPQKILTSDLEDPDAHITPKPFQPKVLGKTDFIVAYGKRREGKSWAVRWTLSHTRAYFAHGEVFTATAFNGFWQKHFPGWKVFDGWKPGVITAILEEQKKIATLYLRDPTCINPWRLLILDDCVHDCGRDPLLAEIAQTGRHYYLCVIITTQHPTALLPAIRSNADVAMVFRQGKRESWETLARDLCPQLTERNGVAHLQRYTFKGLKPGDPSQCLVFVSRHGNTLKDQMHYLIADDPGNYIIGCREYWDKKSLLAIAEENCKVEKEEASDDDDDVDQFHEVKLPGKHDHTAKREFQFRSDKHFSAPPPSRK